MQIPNKKMISCILPKGIALDIAQKLKDTHNIMTTNINNARGVGKITPLAFRGIAGQSEKEILTVIVDEDKADALFEYIFFEADINRPHGGIMYMHTLPKTTEFVLPEVPEEN